MYAVDWAVKKELRILDVEKNKLKTILPTIEEFKKFLVKIKKPANFYFEEGGGDSFKLLARRNNHRVFTIPGKRTKEYREKKGLEKGDEADAIIIGLLAKSQPDEFYEFQELDEVTARIAIIYKQRCDVEMMMVRAKNQFFALKNRLELINLDGYKDRIINGKKLIIVDIQKDFERQTKILGKEVKKHPIWNYFEGIKGIGPAVAGGLIANIKRASRFPNKYSLRNYAGMIAKSEGQTFNHKLKRVLFFFTEGIVKARTPQWRDLYDNMKIYYKNKHPDWKKGRINNYAMKFVETKFLDSVYEKMKKIEGEWSAKILLSNSNQKVPLCPSLRLSYKRNAENS